MPGLLQQDSHDRRCVEDHLDPGLSVAQDPLLLSPACLLQVEAINLRPDLLTKKSLDASPALLARRRHDQPQPPLVKGLSDRFGFGFTHPKGDLGRHLLGIVGETSGVCASGPARPGSLNALARRLEPQITPLAGPRFAPEECFVTLIQPTTQAAPPRGWPPSTSIVRGRTNSSTSPIRRLSAGRCCTAGLLMWPT